jgi:lycopene cyclase domain-containing protein
VHEVSVSIFNYVFVLLGCLFGSLWLELVLRTRVLKRWRRLIRVLPIVVVVFSLWDAYAIGSKHWNFDPQQTLGLHVPGSIPLDEILFFIVVPICAILSYEGVRSVRPDWDKS